MDHSALPRVYQFRVFLRGISPMIWRRVLVRSDSTIADLHYRAGQHHEHRPSP